MGNWFCCISDSAENKDVSHGLVKKRGCTDVPWLLFLLAFMGGMGYVVYLCIGIGDPYRLMYGVDSWGNTCNRENVEIENVTLSGRNMIGLENTFYYDFEALVSNGLLTSTVVCVAKCPRESILDMDTLKNLSITNETHLCRYDIEPENFVNDTTDVCPDLPLFPYKTILHRCVPAGLLSVGSSIIETAADETTTQLDQYSASACTSAGNIYERVMQDIAKVYIEVGYLSGGSVGVALLVTLLMRFFAAILIRLMVICMALGAIAASGLSWYVWYDYKTKLNKLNETERLEDDVKYVNYWLYGAIALTCFAVIILLILLIMRKRIALVIQLFHEAGKAVGKMPLLVFQPLWTILILAVAAGALCFGGLYVITAEQPTVDATTNLVTFKTGEIVFYMRWYYLLGILWVIQFIFACQTMVIAGSVAYWYFLRDKSEIGCCTSKYPILKATMRLIRYHLGTVAFGSFIIAVIQLIRIVLLYLERKLKGRSSKPLKAMLKVLSCCFWCLEKVMKFFTKNAYIMVSIYGCNLCTGGKRAMQTIINNILRVGAINSIGVFTLFMGKLLIVGIVVIAGVYLYKDRTDICYMYVPLILLGIIAFFIAHCFLGVYGMAIDTIFLCFCVDSDYNDGGRKPYFMSKGLMQFVTVASVTYSRERLVPIANNNNLNNKSKTGQSSRSHRPARQSTRRQVSDDVEW